MGETAGSLDIVLRAGVEMTSLGSAEVQKQTKGLIAGTRAIDSHTDASKRNLGQIAAWALGWKVAYGAINLVSGAIRGTISNMLHMEQEMARLSIVTGATGRQLANVRLEVRALAKAYGISSLEVAKAAKIYAQQGLSAAQALEMTEIAMRGVVVTGQSTEQMVENLTAAQRGYNLTARETEELLDKWVAVAQKAPVSVDTLAQSYRRASAAASDLGITVDELNAMVSGLAGTMRLTGNQASTALTTIFMRLGREQSMAAVQAIGGVETIAPGGESMRSPFDILRDLAKGWDKLSGAQQQVITQQVAGIRRGKEFVAMLRSWDEVEKSLEVSLGARGEATSAADTMLDTTLSRWQQIKESTLETLDYTKEYFAILKTHGIDIPARAFEDLFGTGVVPTRIRPEAAPPAWSEVQRRQREDFARARTFDEIVSAAGLGDDRTPSGRGGLRNALVAAMRESGFITPEQATGLGGAFSGGGPEAFMAAVEKLMQAANSLDEAGEKLTFGVRTYNVQLEQRMVNKDMAKWFMGTARALGLPGLELGGGQQPYKPREMMRMAEMVRMQGPTAGMAEMAPRGAAGAQVALDIAKRRREEALKLIDIVKQQENISNLVKAATEGSLLAQQMLTLEVQTQFDIVQAQLNIQKAIASEVRAAADAYKGAFGAGLKAIIKGEGTLSDLASGMGETVFQRNIDSLVDKLDKAFLSMGQTEFEWMRRGGVDAATTIAGAMKMAADYHAGRLGIGGTKATGVAGAGVGMTGMDAPVQKYAAGALAAAGIAKSMPVSAGQFGTYEASGIFPSVEEIMAGSVPKTSISGHGYTWNPETKRYELSGYDKAIAAGYTEDQIAQYLSRGGTPEGLVAKGKRWQKAGQFAMGAMQGYSLSGGKWEGALASGMGAMLPGVWGQLGALAGALFRDAPEPEEQERRYQNRVEWENALLEQMVLMNRNLLGVREGGTFAMPGSYYYRARTNDALAGELELAMRG